jgi:hypothetical protein
MLAAGRTAAHIHCGQAQKDANRNLAIRACRLIHPHTRMMADPLAPAQSKKSIRFILFRDGRTRDYRALHK